MATSFACRIPDPMTPTSGLENRQLENFEQFEIPEQIVESWKQACVSKSRAGKNAVFQAFLRGGKDWSKLLDYHAYQHFLI